jgi:hypothetical protein
MRSGRALLSTIPRPLGSVEFSAPRREVLMDAHRGCHRRAAACRANRLPWASITASSALVQVVRALSIQAFGKGCSPLEGRKKGLRWALVGC